MLQSKSNRDRNSQGKPTHRREGMTDDKTNERTTFGKRCVGEEARSRTTETGFGLIQERKDDARMKANKFRGKGNKRMNGPESGTTCKQSNCTIRLPAPLTQHVRSTK